jgi:hypothetical protein
MAFAVFCCTGAAKARPETEAAGRSPLLLIADEDAQFQARVERAQRLLKDKVTIKLRQNQFDGLVSLAMSAPEAFDGPLLVALNKGDFAAATTLMLDYDKVRDSLTGRMAPDPALRARRVAERDLILYGIYAGIDEVGQGQDKPWSYHCSGDTCAITSEIRNDDAPTVVAMRLDFVVDRRAKTLNEVLFRLPPETRGKSLAFAFAKTRASANGPSIDLVPGSTRTFAIKDCNDTECRVVLPAGLLAAGKDVQGMDVGSAIRADDQMLVNYPSGKDYYRTSILLSGLHVRDRQLASTTPTP